MTDAVEQFKACTKCRGEGILHGCQRRRRGCLHYYSDYCDCPAGQARRARHRELHTAIKRHDAKPVTPRSRTP